MGQCLLIQRFAVEPDTIIFPRKVLSDLVLLHDNLVQFTNKMLCHVLIFHKVDRRIHADSFKVQYLHTYVISVMYCYSRFSFLQIRVQKIQYVCLVWENTAD